MADRPVRRPNPQFSLGTDRPRSARGNRRRGREMVKPYALENVLQEMAEIYRRFL